ncbi:hypothetical protein Lesp02_83870 [Lentzea sp. NBRC 105346]|uniref:hypothetical protein n=1 Tax=Lentzea sp. NBRC 105346 TaxID=3032205 RepID=UPI0024A03537|nr:hypothetical protein [Lentzea sp. NBRC 105346]GLZ36200.1 hypothetical protein Lesp02_83870 [Lentzea sp. NBRC 105346]
MNAFLFGVDVTAAVCLPIAWLIRRRTWARVVALGCVEAIAVLASAIRHAPRTVPSCSVRVIVRPPAASVLQGGRECAAGSGAREDCAAPAPAAPAAGEDGISPAAATNQVHLSPPAVHRPQVGAAPELVTHRHAAPANGGLT